MGQKRDNDDALKRMKSKKEERQVKENKPTGKALKIKEKHDQTVNSGGTRDNKRKTKQRARNVKKDGRWRKTGGEPERYQNQKNKIIIRKNFSKT